MLSERSRRGDEAQLAILFADIVGSTRLYAERGDARAFELTANCLGLVEEQVAAAGGRAVKRLGDGVLAVFSRPEHALLAAVRMRERVGAPALLRQAGVRVRIGISFGAALVAGDDVYGDMVNVGARVAGLASSDEILLAAAAYEALRAAAQSATRLIDELPLRNHPAPMRVYEYVGDEADTTLALGLRPRAPGAQAEVTHGELRLVLDAERPRLVIGRTAEADICIADAAVSRTHAEIVWRHDRILLVDHSTNGTVVHVDHGPPVRVVREELALSGTGTIAPGVEARPPIRFSVRGG